MIEYIKFWLAQLIVEAAAIAVVLVVAAVVFIACYLVFLFMKGR
jgi:hypothetical protein